MATLQVSAADGCALVRWYSLSGNATASCVIPAGSGFDLRKNTAAAGAPPVYEAPRWSAILWSQPTATLPPFDMIITTTPLTGPLPASLPPLGVEDAQAKEALLSNYTTLYSQLWPAEGYIIPPPIPPTLETRSFYKLRTLEAAADSDQDGVPNAFETAWNPAGSASDRLILTEVCYSAIKSAQYDWVELYNPTETTLTTAGLFITDSASNPAKHALPLFTVLPGQRLVLHCSGYTAATLPPGTPDALKHLPFALKDEGETVRLYKANPAPPPGGTQTYTLCNALTRPDSSVWPSGPHSDVTWGITVAPDGVSLTYGFSTRPSPGAMNDRWVASVALPEPQILDVGTSDTSTVPLTGTIFRSGIRRARLQLPPGAPAGTAMLYTLDGSEPGGASLIYSEPIEIHRTAVLRAKAVGSGYLSSHTVARTFIHTPSVIADVGRRVAAAQSPADALTIASQWAYAPPPDRATSRIDAADGLTPLGGYTAPCILDQLESRPAIFLSGPPPSDWTGESVVSFELYMPASGGAPAYYSQEQATMQRTGHTGGSGSGEKYSWDLQFKKGATFAPAGDWQGPVAADGTSRLFPGSRVTRWKRLKLRNPGQASFPFTNPEGSSAYPRMYMNDAWLKETQRALGGNSAFITGQRRWVHVWLNGVFYGLYDLEEFHDSDTISAHLTAAALAALPTSASQAAKDAVREANKAGNIQFLKPFDDGTPSTPGADVAFNSEVLIPCKTAAQNRDPSAEGYQAAWNAALAHFDPQDYARYIIACEIVGKGDLSGDQYRMWRHPVDQKWRFIAWDGDAIAYKPQDEDRRYLKGARTTKVGSSWRLVPLPIGDVDILRLELRPLEYLLGHEPFRQAFGSVLVPASDRTSSPLGCLTPLPLTARFDTMAQDIRSTLEAEAMAWGTSLKLDAWSRSYPVLYNGLQSTAYDGMENARRPVSETLLGLRNIPNEIISVPSTSSDSFNIPTTSLNSLIIRAGRMGLMVLPPP